MVRRAGIVMERVKKDIFYFRCNPFHRWNCLGIIKRFLRKLPLNFEGSTIGGVDVGGKTADEAITAIIDEVEQWKNEGELTVTSGGRQVVIPYDKITFDIQTSVKLMEKKLEKPWYAFFKKIQPQHLPLQVQVEVTASDFAELKDIVNIKKTTEQIVETVAFSGNMKFLLWQKNRRMKSRFV